MQRAQPAVEGFVFFRLAAGKHRASLFNGKWGGRNARPILLSWVIGETRAYGQTTSVSSGYFSMMIVSKFFFAVSMSTTPSK